MGSVLGVGVQGKAVLSIHRAETATKGEVVVDVHSPLRGRMAAVEGPWGRECLAAARCEAGTEQVSHHTEDNPGCNKGPTWLSGDVGDRGTEPYGGVGKVQPNGSHNRRGPHKVKNQKSRRAAYRWLRRRSRISLVGRLGLWRWLLLLFSGSQHLHDHDVATSTLHDAHSCGR